MSRYSYSANDIRELAEASVTLTSELSLEAVLQKVVDVAIVQIGARYAALSVLGEDGRIERFVTSGISAEERERIGDPPSGRGLLGVLLHEGTSLRIDDVGKDPRSAGFPPHHPLMKSLLGVPVVWRAEILGNLYLTEKTSAPGFDERDEQLLRFLATQAAVAINNAQLYEAQQLRARDWQTLFELSRDVIGSRDLPDLRAFVTESAAGVLHVDVAVLGLLSPDRASFRIEAQHGTRATNIGDVIPVSEAVLFNRVITDKRPVVIEDRRSGPAGRKSLMEREMLESAIAVPVLGDQSVLGALIAGHRTRTRLGQRNTLLVQTLANLLAVAIERHQLFDRLDSLARLEERERIGMDLHDGVIQSIYAVALHLEDCADRARKEPDMHADLDRAIDDLNKVIKDIRSYIFDLRPQLSHVQDVPQALHELVEHFRVNSLIAATLDIDPSFSAVGEEAEAMALFHIAQEALNNAAKHSKATAVSIRLRATPASVILEVEDNGIGFEPPPDGVSGAHHGLRNMRDRARSVGGMLSYDSAPGRGTTVRITLPGPRKD